tara:strand:+ start:4796 stop:5482 length:687 start_codon:yes stop_codon:yes gene_type:complete
MNAYKIMRATHYKLGGLVDTTQHNYGSRTGRNHLEKALAEAAIEVCSQSDITFQQMIDFIHKQQVRAKGLKVPNTITRAQATRLKFLGRSAPSIVKSGFGATFWEALYERIRTEERPDCPSRLKSYFASRDIDSLRLYRDEHWANRMGDKVTCAIDISRCPVAFDADTAILDEVGAGMTYRSARPNVLRYWDQEKSSRPIMEVLLQGTVVLGEQIDLLLHGLEKASPR